MKNKIIPIFIVALIALCAFAPEVDVKAKNFVLHHPPVDGSITISPDPVYLDDIASVTIYVTKEAASAPQYVLIDTFLGWENMTHPPLILEKNKTIKVGESWQHKIPEKLLEAFVKDSCEVVYGVNIKSEEGEYFRTIQKSFYFYNNPRTSKPTQTPTPTLTPSPTPTPTPSPTPASTPGFEAVFGIAGLLAVAYLLRMKG